MAKTRACLFFILLFVCGNTFSQGFNHNWLICYDVSPYTKGRISITDTSFIILAEQRKIPFRGSTEGNISDVNANLLMSSNGVWIANSTGDTMLNGAGLNPGFYVNNWPNGLPLFNANIFLPNPADSSEYILIHQTGGNNASSPESLRLYYSLVDINGDNGLGEVTNKNQTIFQTKLGWGLSAVKHANGRDWWTIALSDSGNVAHKVLITKAGIQYYGLQVLNVPKRHEYGGEPKFSHDGTKFSYSHFVDTNGIVMQDIRLFDFDRCTGVFSNPVVTLIPDSILGFGVAFSPNSRYLYTSSFSRIYQLDTDATNVSASMQLIAVNDTFASPQPPFYTDFWHMYLAANGKIYLTSGSGVEDLHLINLPDSAGINCDVQLHSIHLPCVNLRAVPNHPNYYLGPVTGSICDSLTTGLEELEHNFNFSVAPNPSSGTFKTMYLLPQNKSGTLAIYDLTGRAAYSMLLSPWSTLQNLNLSHLKNGLYHMTITSDNFKESKKLVILK